MNSEMLPEETWNPAELVAAVSGELMTTGIAGLDEMLGGGIPMGSTVFICGSTGTGKTILAQQMAFANTAAGHNVVYLYLRGFSESITRRVRGLESFDFFNRGEFNVNVHYQDIFPVVRAAQSTDLLASVSILVQQRDAKLIIMDSIKIIFEKLEEFNRGELALRTMTEFVSENNLIALLVGEYQQDDIVSQSQFTFADGIILLTAPYESPDGKRYIRVLKMRDADHCSAAREFRIGPSGVEVLPDTQAEGDAILKVA